MKAAFSPLVIFIQYAPLALTSARAAAQEPTPAPPPPPPPPLPTEPFQPPPPTEDGTFVTVSDYQVNWGNANPWDVVPLLNLPGGPCRKNARCDYNKELKVPTLRVDQARTVKKPKEEELLVKITDSWWDTVGTRDNMISSIAATAQKYNKAENVTYYDARHPVKNKPSEAQNMNTNKFLAEVRDVEGETRGKIEIVAYASKWSSTGWCDDITKRANFTQGQDVPLGEVPMLGRLDEVGRESIGRLSVECN
ncbi:MAG: hypothetical protein M1831_002395 [Alyxoria varia]|nr:MAG: hypothetical protein M1831_002395 [Alyxoria varia]